MDTHVDTIDSLAIEILEAFPEDWRRRREFDTYVKAGDFAEALRYLRGYDRYPRDAQRFKGRLGKWYDNLDYIRANYRKVNGLLTRWEVLVESSRGAGKLSRRDHLSVAV